MGNVASLVGEAARQFGDKVALVDAQTGKRWSFVELHAHVCQISEALRVDFEPGDTVALHLDDNVSFALHWLGALHAGLTTLPMSPQAAPAEIDYRLAHADCRGTVRDEISLGTIVASTSAPHAVPEDGIAMLLYTSGTTGAPKGAAITHDTLIAHTTALVRDVLRLQPDDRVLATLPLTHSYGLRMTLLAPLVAGATIFAAPTFSARRSLQLIVDEAITWTCAVPTMLHAWALADTDVQPTTLKWCLSAGAPLSRKVRDQAQKRLNAEVREGYGLTEATFCTVNAPPDEQIDGSVGKPVPGVTLAIADDNGVHAQVGKPGEVLVRGCNVMAGYLNDRTATQHVMRNGWLHTGDVGRLDEQGRLFIVDRIKDMILVGGRNVYPAEVEHALVAHPDVAQAAVVGLEDAHYGQQVVAVLVPRDKGAVNLAALSRHIGQQLAPYKWPKHVAIADALPIGNSGKVLKRILVDALQDQTLATQPLGA